MSDTPQDRDKAKLERALERTAPASDFTPEAVRRDMRETDGDHTPEETAQQYLRKTNVERTPGETASISSTAPLTSFGSSQDMISMPGVQEGAADTRRFEVLGEIGHGATSRVYAVRDKSLGRIVAVKQLRHGRAHKESVRERFLHEARVTATLEHPNIMPIHDIGTTERGEVHFSMKNIKGSSLGDAIRIACEGPQEKREIASADALVRVFLKICDAMAFAHSRGFIHQDLKPDNIMLGEHGEVLVLDWGSALSTEELSAISGKALFGTPAYMSPEQARRERADQRSDVYCIGTTFFHALLLRHPTWADDPEVFWDKKRRGTLDLPTDDERRRVPPALLDIALKAMRADSNDRYQAVEEFAEELKRWQSGLSVRAHHESLAERFVRWYGRNARIFWVVTASSVVIAGVATMLFREKLRELVTWRLIHEQTFSHMSTDSLWADWTPYNSNNWATFERDTGSGQQCWTVESGTLTGTAKVALSNLSYARTIPGDIRAEWDVTPLGRSDNLNCFIAGPHRLAAYCFHVGGFGYSRSVTLTRGRQGETLIRAPLPFELEVGATYRFRMEKEGKSVRMFVDGHRVIDYRDLDPLAGPGHQSFGLEVNNGNKVAFDNIKVFHHPLPLKVSPVATPDDYREQGNLERALIL